MMTKDRLDRIKALHAEFEEYGMMDGDWGIQAHEHRAHLIEAYDAMAARAAALEADRDRIELTVAVCGADRDKWFNRARDLEKALVSLLARFIVLADAVVDPVYVEKLPEVIAARAALRPAPETNSAPVSSKSARELALEAAVLDFLSIEATITSDEELSRYHATIAELRRLTAPETEVLSSCMCRDPAGRHLPACPQYDRGAAK